MFETTTLTTLAEARRFTNDHGIRSAADWQDHGWFMRYEVLDRFKAMLAAEVQPGSDGWRAAVERLKEVLHMESER